MRTYFIGRMTYRFRKFLCHWFGCRFVMYREDWYGGALERQQMVHCFRCNEKRSVGRLLS